MDNAQNCDSYINIPSSRTYRYYLDRFNSNRPTLTYFRLAQAVAVAVAFAVNLRPTVSRPVCPGVRRPSGACDQFFFLLKFLLDSCGFVIL
jgi:hypothetical protein